MRDVAPWFLQVMHWRRFGIRGGGPKLEGRTWKNEWLWIGGKRWWMIDEFSESKFWGQTITVTHLASCIYICFSVCFHHEVLCSKLHPWCRKRSWRVWMSRSCTFGVETCLPLLAREHECCTDTWLLHWPSAHCSLGEWLQRASIRMAVGLAVF